MATSRDTTYLTLDNLKELTSISNNVDEKMLLPYISSAELMHVLPILGTALDTELKNDITGNTLSGDNYQLVYEYILPVSAYAAWHDASTFMHVKTTNKGLVHQFSDSSSTVDFKAFATYRQNIKDKLTFYEKRLKEFLDDNQTTYPLYRSDDDCDDNHNDFSSSIFIY